MMHGEPDHPVSRLLVGMSGIDPEGDMASRAFSLLQLDVCCPYHLAPLLDFVDDELAEFVR